MFDSFTSFEEMEQHRNEFVAILSEEEMNTFLCGGAAKLAARAHTSHQNSTYPLIGLGRPLLARTTQMAGENPFIEIVKNRQFQRQIV